jgi:hypothetical protein
VTASPDELRNALDVWAFEPEAGGWDDVLRRAEAAGWSDVLRRARPRRRLARLSRPSRRTLVIAGALLAVAAPALGLVASTQTIGRDSAAPGPRLTARLGAPGGGSGTFAAALPGTAIAHRGRRGLFVPVRIARPGSGGHRAFAPLVWRLQLRGVPEPVESVRFRKRGGGVLATLCAPCVRSSGRTRLPVQQTGPLFNCGAYLEVKTAERTLRGRVRFVSRLHCARREKGAVVCGR